VVRTGPSLSAVLNMSQSAIGFNYATPKLPITGYVSDGFTSVRAFATLSQTCDTTASLNVYVRTLAAFVGTMANQLTSVGLFRSA
jgi:hypothetical protein